MEKSIGYYIVNGELIHHGIKGQKWGVRRYQNRDGTLTAAGRAHLGVGESRGSKKADSSNSDSRKSTSSAEEPQAKKEFHLSDRQKTALKVGAVAVASALAVYGASKLYDHAEIVSYGKNLTDKILSEHNNDFQGALNELRTRESKIGRDKAEGNLTEKQRQRGQAMYVQAEKQFKRRYENYLENHANNSQIKRDMDEVRDFKKAKVKARTDAVKSKVKSTASNLKSRTRDAMLKNIEDLENFRQDARETRRKVRKARRTSK